MLLTFLIAGWSTSAARASVSGGEWASWPSLQDYTLEALTVDSNLIVIAALESGSSSADNWQGTFVPGEILKSPPGYVVPPRLEATLFLTHLDKATLRFPSKGATVLLFFGSVYDNPTAVGRFQDGVILDLPGDARSIISPTIVDLTLRPMRDNRRVLPVVREELHRVPSTGEVTGFLTYPLESYWVPRDDRLLPAARLWAKSDDPRARCMAAGAFARYPEPQDVEALKSLLTDPFVTDMPLWLSPWSGREYLVRDAAWRALDRRHIALPVPTVDLPRPGLYQPMSLAWPVVLMATLLLAFNAGRIALRRRLRRPARSWIRHVAASISFACVALAVAAGLAWHRSMHTADDIVYARGGLLVDVASVQDNVYIEWGRSWPEETQLVHAAVTPDPVDPSRLNRDGNFRHRFGTGNVDNLGSLWETYIDPWDQRPWLFDADFSHVCDDWPSILSGRPLCKGWVLVCAYPYLIALLLSVPAAYVLPGLIIRNWQRGKRNRRLKRGLCPQCAYDLRAHGPGERCPECGGNIVADGGIVLLNPP